jgi:hypothetical protein
MIIIHLKNPVIDKDNKTQYTHSYDHLNNYIFNDVSKTWDCFIGDIYSYGYSGWKIFGWELFKKEIREPNLPDYSIYSSEIISISKVIKNEEKI